MAPVQQDDCPTGEMCCAATVHLSQAVLASPGPPVRAVTPRTLWLPGAPGSSATLAPRSFPGEAPDLHVLQVQRT